MIKGFNGKRMTHTEALHLCGCEPCVSEIKQRAKEEPKLKPDFVDYLVAKYPKTGHLSQ